MSAGDKYEFCLWFCNEETGDLDSLEIVSSVMPSWNPPFGITFITCNGTVEMSWTTSMSQNLTHIIRRGISPNVPYQFKEDQDRWLEEGIKKGYISEPTDTEE